MKFKHSLIQTVLFLLVLTKSTRVSKIKINTSVEKESLWQVKEKKQEN